MSTPSPTSPNYEIDQLVFECATPCAGEVEAFSAANRIQEVDLGVVNHCIDESETVDYVVGKVEEALHHFQPQNIYLNPDCGSAPSPNAP